jgi:two-component system response regulator RegX3
MAMIVQDARPRTALVIDSDVASTESIRSLLGAHGFEVRTADGHGRGLEAFLAIDPDVVIMDIDLRDGSGLDTCRELRRRSTVPVLIVSRRTSEFDVVVALEVGADGYVVQPYRPRELVARVRALLRRAGDRPSINSEVLIVGDITLDIARHVVEIRGCPISLPLKEFALLELLMRHPGRALPREHLMEEVWGRARRATKTLDLHIKRLRQHVELDPMRPNTLVTVRGFGFRLEVRPQAHQLDRG